MDVYVSNTTEKHKIDPTAIADVSNVGNSTQLDTHRVEKMDLNSLDWMKSKPFFALTDGESDDTEDNQEEYASDIECENQPGRLM